MAIWEHCLENDQLNRDVKSCIIGVKKKMKIFELFFGLNVGHCLFSHTDNLSKTLQGKKITTRDSKKTAKLVASVL